MSQDELAIKILIDPTQFREELSRLRRDLEDQQRIEMDRLREERREDVITAPTQPTVVEIREGITGLDKDTADKLNQMAEEMGEIKRRLGIPAEFARLTPERLQEMVREAFKAGGFKDILERDPQMAEDIAWIVERGVARYPDVTMDEVEGMDEQTFGALQKVYNTLMYKHPYASGRRMRMWRNWVTEATRQLAIGEVAVTEPQTEEERRAYMSMGHRAYEVDVQRILGEMGKQAGLEFRLPFGEGERRADVFARYMAESVDTGEDISAIIATEVKASGQPVGGAGGVAAQMAEQVRAVMRYLQEDIFKIENYEDFKDFMRTHRRVRGEEGEAGIVKMVLASYKDVSLSTLKANILSHLASMSPSEREFFDEMIMGDTPGIEIVTDICPVGLQKKFAELWDSGRRDVNAYSEAIASFVTTPEGVSWMKDRVRTYNPTFSRASLEEIERALTGAAAFAGTEPERIEVVFEALQRLFEGEETGRPHTFIEGVSRILGVSAAEAFPGIFARTGGRAATVRALRGRLPGYFPELAETLVRERPVEVEQEEVTRMAGLPTPESMTRAMIEQEERIEGARADPIRAGWINEIRMTTGIDLTEEQYMMMSPAERARIARQAVEDFTAQLESTRRHARERPEQGYEELIPSEEAALAYAYQEMFRAELDETQREMDWATGRDVVDPTMERFYAKTWVPMEYDPQEYLASMKKVSKAMGFKQWTDFVRLIEEKSAGTAERTTTEQIGRIAAVVGATFQQVTMTPEFAKRIYEEAPTFWKILPELPGVSEEGVVDPTAYKDFFDAIAKREITSTGLVKMSDELMALYKSPEIRAMVDQRALTQIYDTAIFAKRIEQATLELEPAFGGLIDYWT